MSLTYFFYFLYRDLSSVVLAKSLYMESIYVSMGDPLFDSKEQFLKLCGFIELDKHI